MIAPGEEPALRCARHLDRDAVGLCRVCLRGLCADRAAEFGSAIVCRGVHDADFAALRADEDRRMLLAAIADRGFPGRRIARSVARAAWFVATGLALMATATIEPILTPWVIGVAFTVAGLWMLLPHGDEPGAERDDRRPS